VLRGRYTGLPPAKSMILPVPQGKVFRLSGGSIEEIVVPD
jgi:hypothetical protein